MKNKYLKYIAAFSITTVMFFVTGCLKDSTSPGSENYSHSPALVGFQYTGFAFAPAVASILGTPQDSFAIEVSLSVASQTLSKPVTLTIAADAASLSAYNADSTQSNYGTTFIQLPSTQFTIGGNGTITIPAGENKVNFTVHFAGDKIDFTKDNALALKITDASGAVVATNLNTYIILIKLQSIYAGNYTGSGYRDRPTLGDSFAITGTIPFGTVTAKEIDGQLADAGSGYSMALLVHDDQPAPYPVDVLPDPLNPSTTPSAITQGTNRGQSTYDPTTKTFDLHFSYTTSSIRVVNERLVRQ